MWWFYAGVVVFSAAVGYFVGSFASSMLSAGLLAIAGAITAIFGILEKLRVDGKFSASERVDPAGVPAVFSKDLGNALGKLLLAMTLGFGLGLGGGLCVHSHSPLLFTDRLAVVVPWKDNKEAPQHLKDAMAWLAISERLRSAGVSKDEIQALYGKYSSGQETPTFLGDKGSRWVDSRPGAPMAASAPPTPAAPPPAKAGEVTK